MSKVEKVRIELPNKPALKNCKTTSPVTGKFKLIPKYMPFLTQLISDLNWSCKDKTLQFKISETSKFDAFNWFDGMAKRMAESQKSSFVDLEQDSLLLVLFDESDKEILSIKFKCLSLIEHQCCLNNSFFGIETPKENLEHFVTIGYAESEIFLLDVEEDLDFKLTPEKKNELVDEEWQEKAMFGNEDFAVS